ncbi:MAG: BMP family ABC transporter substrate-binding protein [Eubacteriales bacterium]|nr:BMP family ABC transporter substrate-binding protein [Eubacteriales bacterium]
MKKAVSIILCLVLAVTTVFAVSGCTKQDSITSDVVLITDGGNVKDGGYNQSAWEGITSFGDENALTYRYYQPVLDDNGELTIDSIEKYVDLSAQNGAQYIVFPGEDFAVAAYEIAPSYPDIRFILLDAIPHSQGDDVDRFVSNVMCVSFDTLQSGYLAGYIAVMNGNTELGFLGEMKSDDSASYGAGFVQGAALAADSLGIPVTVDWADYDSPLCDYDYNITVTACYDKIDEADGEVYTVNVVGGTGSGTYSMGSNVTITADPAPLGQEFDRWEIKSDTEGVKDKKVNVSSKTEASMNLIAEKCDCTLTAVYKDIEGTYYSVKTMSNDGKTVALEQSVSENGQCDIIAPAAPADMVFDHWESSVQDAVEDAESPSTKVNVKSADVTVTPVYKVSDIPTFNVTVVTGDGGNGESTGSGSYVAGDTVNVAAAVPQDGYMFSHWENSDADGQSTGIAMGNEYYWNTSFEMVDRYAALCEKMYDHGATMVFAGGNSKADSAFTAKWNFDYDLGVMAAGENNGDAYSTIVKDYGKAVKDCLADYQGGSVIASNCATDGIFASFVSEDEEVQASYDKVYKALAEGKITPVLAEGGAGYDFCKAFNEVKMSNCLTLNGYFIENTVAVEVE